MSSSYRVEATAILALVAFAAWSLFQFGLVIMPALGFGDTLKLSSAILRDEPDSRFYSHAMTKTIESVYVIAGDIANQGKVKQGAIAVRVSPGSTDAQVLWRYSGSALDQIPRIHGVPDFRGVATTPGGSVFLCGHIPGNPQQDQPSLLTLLNASGVEISEKRLLPPLRTATVAPGNPAPSGAAPDIVTGEFENCLAWGDRIAIVGRASRYFPSQTNPRVRDHNSYYWVVVVDGNGELVWQKTFPIGFDAIDEWTSALVAPDGRLLFTFRRIFETELLSVSQNGELLARKRLPGDYLLVHPTTASSIVQIVGGNPDSVKSLITLNESLQEISRIDGLDAPHFVIWQAYGLPASSLMLFGSAIRSRGAVLVSSVRYIAASGKVKSQDLAQGSFYDGGAAKIAVPTGRAGEFVTARDQLQHAVSGDSRVGIAIDFLHTTQP